eukprot:8455460-Karenia_brevis.AAC.1
MWSAMSAADKSAETLKAQEEHSKKVAERASGHDDGPHGASHRETLYRSVVSECMSSESPFGAS